MPLPPHSPLIPTREPRRLTHTIIDTAVANDFIRTTITASMNIVSTDEVEYLSNADRDLAGLRLLVLVGREAQAIIDEKDQDHG